MSMDEPMGTMPPDADTSNPFASLPSQFAEEAPAQQLALATQFGRYQIVKELGRGGMGSVYLAHDTHLDRRVALKVPRFLTRDGPRVLERFTREARAAATLNHPNLCPIHDVGEVNGIHYLTMAYIEGRPLSEFIRGPRRLSQRQVAALVRKLALALHEAHAAGIVHRDLKPANIMINRRGEPVVMDFGLAKRLGGLEFDAPHASPVDPPVASAPLAAALTQDGAILGTPAYMAPEQVRGNIEAMGPACDIYALGTILYEMLAGRLPFRGSVEVILGRILSADPEPLATLRLDIDAELESICVKAMAKKPEERYGSMAALAEVLSQYLGRGGHSTSAARQEYQAEKVFAEFAHGTLASIPGRSTSRLDKRRLPPRAWLALIGAAVVVLALLVLYVATDHGTLRIELSDPAAEVEVRVDGEVVAAQDRQQPLSLRAGRHHLRVTGKTVDSISTPFTVRRGENESLPIKLTNKPPAKAAVGKPAKPPPLSNKVAEIRRFDGHSGPVWSVALSPDGRHAVSCSADGTLRVWGVETGEQLSRMATLSGVLEGVAISPNARQALSGGRDHLVRLWDLEAGQETRRFKGHAGTIRSVAFSPDGRRALSASVDASVRLWDLEQEKAIHVLAGHEGHVKGVAFSPDGRRALSAALDQTVREWDLETGRELRRLTGHTSGVWCVAYSPDGRHALSGSGRDDSLKPPVILWDLATGAEVRRLGPGAGKCLCLAFSPDGRRALLGHLNVVYLWDLQTGKEICRLEGHTQPVHGVVFLPDGRRALSCAWDHTLRLWQLPEP